MRNRSEQSKDIIKFVRIGKEELKKRSCTKVKNKHSVSYRSCPKGDDNKKGLIYERYEN